MEKVINLAIPHVGEQIFESIETDDLTQLLEVSHAWKVLALNILLKRWSMLEACKTGKTKDVELLLKHFNCEENGLNIKDEYGWTPFMWACLRGHKDVVKLLLDFAGENIDLNASSRFGYNALLFACDKGHKEIVQMILDYPGQDIDLNVRKSKQKSTMN